MGKTAEQIGKRIRDLRRQKHLSQAKLAELSDCHETYIGQLERGEKNATLETVARIASGLNVPLSRLFEAIGPTEEVIPNIPLQCYELIAEKPPAEQDRLYRLLLEIEQYKNS